MEIAELIKAIGDSTVTVVICAAVIYLLIKYFSKLIDTKVKSKDETHKQASKNAIQYNSVAGLKELHPVFDTINSIIDLRLPTVRLGGPVRTKIFKDTLKIYYETLIEVINGLLDKTITNNNFLSENRKMINRIVSLSKERMKEFGIPDVVIDNFWEWNRKRHEYALSSLSDIDSSSIFETVVEKQYITLNLLSNIATFAFMDAEQTLQHLNGNLTGTLYKGEVVEDLHYGEKKNDA